MARPRVRPDSRYPNKYLVEYRDQDRKQRRLRGFSTKKEADKKAAEIERELSRSVDVVGGESVSFVEACQLWLTRAENNKLIKSTRSQYANHVNIHLLPLRDSDRNPAWRGELGTLKLARVKPLVVIAIRRELTRKLNSELSRKVMASFKSILGEAVKRGVISHNPAVGIKSTELRKISEGRIHEGVDFPTKEEWPESLVF